MHALLPLLSIRIAIADDEGVVRAGLRMILEAEPDLEVAGEAADGAEAIEVVRRTRPDVALMDIRMPGTDGIQRRGRVAYESGLVRAGEGNAAAGEAYSSSPPQLS